MVAGKMEDLKRLVQAVNCSLFTVDVKKRPRSSSQRNFVKKISDSLGILAALYESDSEMSAVRARTGPHAVHGVRSRIANLKTLDDGTASFHDSSKAGLGLSFMSCCFWCKKKLDGLDLFMYRGDMAFCSGECRNKQMTLEERSERLKYREARKLSCSSKVTFSAVAF